MHVFFVFVFPLYYSELVRYVVLVIRTPYSFLATGQGSGVARVESLESRSTEAPPVGGTALLDRRPRRALVQVCIGGGRPGTTVELARDKAKPAKMEYKKSEMD